MRTIDLDALAWSTLIESFKDANTLLEQLPQEFLDHTNFNPLLFIETLENFANNSDEFIPAMQRRIFRLVVKKVIFDLEYLELEFDTDGVMEFFCELLDPQKDRSKMYRRIFAEVRGRR